MRRPTAEEEPYADWMVDIEGFDPLYLINDNILTNSYIAAIMPPKDRPVMEWRRYRKEIAEKTGDMELYAFCKPEDARFLVFMQFEKVYEDEDWLHYVRRPL